MPYIVKNLPKLITATSSGGAAVTQAIGKLDDASSITIFLASSAAADLGATATVQISQFDPFDPFPQPGVTESSNFVTAGTVTSSLTAVVLSNVSFRGLRLSFTGTSSGNGETVAFVSKQISV